MKLIRLILFLIISLIHIKKFKLIFLNLIPGVKVLDSKIGFLNVIYCESVEIKNSKIGSFNLFNIEKKISIKESLIFNFNCFICFKKLILYKNSIIGSYNIIFSIFPKSSIFISRNSQVSNHSFFELNGSIIFRNNVIFGGHESMLLKQNDFFEKTFFNRNIFIGSKSLIKSGSKIKCSNSTIGACTVINKNLDVPGKYFSKKLNKLFT
jgi:hypothetical protein